MPSKPTTPVLFATFFVARAAFICGVVLFYILRYLAGSLLLRLAFEPRARRQEWFGRTLTALFRRLGATFIKVGQIMSTRPDLLPPHVIRALETLQDNVGPFAFHHVERTFLEDFGKLPMDLFADIDPRPIASASVAQVHAARLHDGRKVAVKVRRPRIERVCDFDLRVMRLGARLIGLWPSIGLLAPAESVDEFGRGIRQQLDFVGEAGNNRRFRANFAGVPDVRFPALVNELCSRRILTMELIEGGKLLAPDTAASRDPAMRRRLAGIGFRTMLKMIFEDGFVHADLHPGNIMVTDDGTVVLLDLGLVAVLDDDNRTGLARYYAAWVTGDGVTMAQIMAAFSPSKRVPNYPAFERGVVEFVARYHGKKLGEVDAAGVLFDMLGILRRHRVRANPVFTMTNIAICVTDGIGKQLDPTVDLMAEAVPFFARLQLAAPPASTPPTATLAS